MLAKYLFGALGALLGLGFPYVAVQTAGPPLGWHATGGREALSLFALEAKRFRPGNEPLLLVGPPCPDEPWRERRLISAAFPEARPDYRGLIACVLVGADGRPARVLILDSHGRALNERDLVALIFRWRFAALPKSEDVATWHRLRFGRPDLSRHYATM
jgi:hypothetical protein